MILALNKIKYSEHHNSCYNASRVHPSCSRRWFILRVGKERLYCEHYKGCSIAHHVVEKQVISFGLQLNESNFCVVTADLYAAAVRLYEKNIP